MLDNQPIVDSGNLARYGPAGTSMHSSSSPLISIITVTYNSATVIEDALKAVASQLDARIEHIVIDGASTDDTMSIVKRYTHSVTRWVSEPDEGIYDAMNKGIALATGDWIGFLNADDMLYDPHTISRIAHAAALPHRPHVIFGDLVYVDEQDSNKVIRFWRTGAFTINRLRRGWMPPHPTVYMRRSVLQELGGFSPGLRIAADYDLILRCFKRRGVRAHYIPKVLVKMRTGGISNRSLKTVLTKSREDLLALRRSGVGGLGTLVCKNLRKLPQWITKPAPTQTDSQKSVA